MDAGEELTSHPIPVQEESLQSLPDLSALSLTSSALSVCSTNPFAGPCAGAGPAAGKTEATTSSDDGPALSPALPPPTPSNAATSWHDVDCSEGAKAVLRDAGLGPAAGEQLVQRLGFSDPDDLSLITPAMAASLQLRPLDALKLHRLLAAAHGANPSTDLVGVGAGGGGGAVIPARPSAVTAALSAARAAAAAGGGATVVTLSSGRLQELARCVGACSNAACTIDLGGLAFSGALTHGPSLFLDRSNLSIVGGTLHLSGDQQLMVTGLSVSFVGVTIRGDGCGAAAARSGAPMPAAAAGAAGGAVVPAVAGTGQTAPAARGMVQIQGGGTVSMRGCTVTGCARGATAALLVQDGGELALDRCDLDNNPRGNGVHVLGMSASMSARQSNFRDCQLSALLVDGGGTSRLLGCTVSGVRDQAGITVTGRGSRLGARSSQVVACLPGALFVAGGGAVEMQGCQLGGARKGAGVLVAGGGDALLRDCVVRDNLCGVMVVDGSTAQLQGGEVAASLTQSGLTVVGAGSRAMVRGCKLLDNAGDGVAATDGGSADLSACTLAGNGRAPASAAGTGSVVIIAASSVEGGEAVTAGGGRCEQR